MTIRMGLEVIKKEREREHSRTHKHHLCIVVVCCVIDVERAKQVQKL